MLKYRSLTLEEHFIQYLKTGKCTKRKIRNYINQGLDILGYPYIVYAIYSNCHKRIIEFLLDIHVDPYINDFYISGCNAFSSAIRTQRIDIIELLIKKGIDLNQKLETGQTPFHIACLQGNVDIVKYLIKNGANIHLSDKNNNTPLHLAVKANHANIVKYLLDCKANPNCVNKENNSPLFLVQSCEIAIILIRYGANVNHRNYNNDTPLHKIVKFKSHTIIKILLNHHANPLIINKQKRTPIDIAKYHECKSVNNCNKDKLSGVLLQYSIIVKKKYSIMLNKILNKNNQDLLLHKMIYQYLF